MGKGCRRPGRYFGSANPAASIGGRDSGSHQPQGVTPTTFKITGNTSGTISFFVVQIPTQAKGVRRFVELALGEIRRTAEVEPEDLIVQIQTSNRCREPLP
jgi:hypothetical protein